MKEKAKAQRIFERKEKEKKKFFKKGKNTLCSKERKNISFLSNTKNFFFRGWEQALFFLFRKLEKKKTNPSCKKFSFKEKKKRAGEKYTERNTSAKGAQEIFFLRRKVKKKNNRKEKPLFLLEEQVEKKWLFV